MMGISDVSEKDETGKYRQYRHRHNSQISFVIYEDQEGAHSTTEPEKQQCPSGIESKMKSVLCHGSDFFCLLGKIFDDFFDSADSKEHDEESAEEIHRYGHSVRSEPEPALDTINQTKPECNEHMSKEWRSSDRSDIVSEHSEIFCQYFWFVHICMICIPGSRVGYER